MLPLVLEGKGGGSKHRRWKLFPVPIRIAITKFFGGTEVLLICHKVNARWTTFCKSLIYHVGI